MTKEKQSASAEQQTDATPPAASIHVVGEVTPEGEAHLKEAGVVLEHVAEDENGERKPVEAVEQQAEPTESFVRQGESLYALAADGTAQVLAEGDPRMELGRASAIGGLPLWRVCGSKPGREELILSAIDSAEALRQYRERFRIGETNERFVVEQA